MDMTADKTGGDNMDTPAIASNFHIRYDGDAIREGQIDARALADSLLALTDALEKSNRIVNGRDSQIAVKVDANVQPGSFTITIMTTVKAIGEIGASVTASGLVNVVTLLGFGGAVAVGAYKGGKSLIRFIKEKKNRNIKTVEDCENGAKKVTLDDGCEIDNVSSHVIDLYEDQSVRLAIENMTQVLNRDGIVSMDFWDDERTSPEIIQKSDIPFFKAPDSGILLEHEEERILIISQARLTGEPSGWRFKNDSDEISDFPADVLDPSFLDKIRERKIVLKNGDMVRVCLQTQQSRPRRNLKTSYAILRVIEFLPFFE
jgi:hypothetical protein